MTLPELLRNYAKFNLWANTQMVNWLSSKDPELMTREVPSSFPNLQLTVLHLWDAELAWLSRLRGVSPTEFPSQKFTGTWADAAAGLLDISTQFRDHVLAQQDGYFDERFAYRLFNGDEAESQVADTLLHCFQHATFHRGQLVTIGRSLGLTDPPKTDYIYFTRKFA